MEALPRPRTRWSSGPRPPWGSLDSYRDGDWGSRSDEQVLHPLASAGLKNPTRSWHRGCSTSLMAFSQIPCSAQDSRCDRAVARGGCDRVRDGVFLGVAGCNHSGYDLKESAQSCNHSGCDSGESPRSCNHSGYDLEESPQSRNHSGCDSGESPRSRNHSGYDLGESPRSGNHSGCDSGGVFPIRQPLWL